MATRTKTILRLRVPLIVQIGSRSLRLEDVLSLVPGSIIELDKLSDDELLIAINNKLIGRGSPVKVGENFGIRVNTIDPPQERLLGVELHR